VHFHVTEMRDSLSNEEHFFFFKFIKVLGKSFHLKEHLGM